MPARCEGRRSAVTHFAGIIKGSADAKPRGPPLAVHPTLLRLLRVPLLVVLRSVMSLQLLLILEHLAALLTPDLILGHYVLPPCVAEACPPSPRHPRMSRAG